MRTVQRQLRPARPQPGSGASLTQALNPIEELEETAKLFLLLRGSVTRPLSDLEIVDLDAVFGPASQN